MNKQSNDDWIDEWLGGYDIVIPTRAHVELRKKLAQLSEYKQALERLAKCDLNDANCASMAIANKRIRAIANRALTHSNKDTNHER